MRVIHYKKVQFSTLVIISNYSTIPVDYSTANLSSTVKYCKFVKYSQKHGFQLHFESNQTLNPLLLGTL